MKKRVEPKVILAIFAVLEAVVLGVMVYFMVQEHEKVSVGLAVKTEHFIIIAFGLLLMYIGYVELRARKFSEHLVDEKVKTHALIDALPQPVVVLDDENRIITANERAAQVFGKGAVELLQSEFLPMLDEEAANFLKFRPSGRLPAKIGGRAAELNVVAIRGGRTRLVMVEPPKQVEESPTVVRKREAEADLQPLVESLLKSLPADSTRSQETAKALVRLRKAVNKIENINALFQSPQSEAVDLAAVARKVADDFRVIHSNLGVRVNVTSQGNASVKGDPALLRRAVEEIVFNALCCTKEGGQVDVSVEDQGSQVSIKVRDNGIGIPDDEFGRVFDLGFVGSNQTPVSEGGRGAGLFIARKVAELHKGSVLIESRVNFGTRLTFTVARG